MQKSKPRSKLKSAINKQGLDAVLVSSAPNIAYLTGYSGFSKEEREVMILIVKKDQYILTDKRYLEEIKKYIKNFELEEVSSSIPFRTALEKLIKKHKIKKLGIEENDLTVSEYKSLKHCFNDLPRRQAGLNHFSIGGLRVIKDNNEINTIERACALTDKTFEYILTKIKSGITEKELAFEIEIFIKKDGGDLAFSPIVAFGKHSAIPHHKISNESLLSFPRRRESNSNVILLDFGAKVDNYCSDMTRVVFLGKATKEQKKVYQIVLDAQKRAIEIFNDRSYMLDDQLKSADVDKVAHDYIREQGLEENIFHSLGHGVGLEIHESPHLSSKSKETLKPGMVFTIEPGIYIPEKFGVRIEDTVVLEKNGLRILTNSPKEITEV